jgi:hypothetical protein
MHCATQRRSKHGRRRALVLDLARDACDGSAGGRTGVVPVRLVRQFETGGHRGGVLLVYVNLKSKPYGKVKCITAKHERIPAVHARAVGEVQVDEAFATDHFQAHSADRRAARSSSIRSASGISTQGRSGTSLRSPTISLSIVILCQA